MLTGDAHTREMQVTKSVKVRNIVIMPIVDQDDKVTEYTVVQALYLTNAWEVDYFVVFRTDLNGNKIGQWEEKHVTMTGAMTAAAQNVGWTY